MHRSLALFLFASSALAPLAGCSDGQTGDTGGGDTGDTGATLTEAGDTGETPIDDDPDAALGGGAGADGDASAGSGEDAAGPDDDAGAEDPHEDVTDGPSDDVNDRPPDDEPLLGPDVAVDPETYTFSYIAPMSDGLIEPVNIFNLGDSPLTITQLGFGAGSSDDFSLVLQPPLPKTVQPGKSTFVNVRFLIGGGGPAWLDIGTDDPDTPLVTIPFDSYLKATIDVPEPCAAIVPSALNFGFVERGTTKVMQATLANCSESQPLKLTDIERSVFFFFELSEEFQIDNAPNLPHTIQPGAALDLDVSYSPKLAGPDSGSFDFHTDDPVDPTVGLNVQGVGTAPPPEKLGLQIKLSWDSNLTDVDSHLLAPNGAFFDCDSDCHFGNPSPDWGVQGDWDDDPFLDVDDVDGNGPEHINMTEPQPGTYTFIVHYYDDTYDGSWPDTANAIVEVSSYGNVIATFGPEHLASTNWNWDVFTIDWPSATVTQLGNVYQVPQSAVKGCLNFPFP